MNLAPVLPLPFAALPPHSTPSSHPLVPSFHLQKKGEKGMSEEPGDACYAPDLIIGFRRFVDPRQLR